MHRAIAPGIIMPSTAFNPGGWQAGSFTLEPTPRTNGASSSAFATKGQVFRVIRRSRITRVNLNMDSAGTRSVLLAKASGYGLAATFSDVYKQSESLAIGTQWITLDTPYEVDAGDILYVAATNQGGGATTNVDIRFCNVVDSVAKYLQFCGNRNFAAWDQAGYRITDDNVVNGDSFTDLSDGYWDVGLDYQEYGPQPDFSDCEFVGFGDTTIGNGSTTINVPYPSDIEANDKLMMAIMNRNSITTPSGWTQVDSQIASGFTQYTRWFEKDAAGTETGNLTVTQTGTGRFLGVMCNFRGDGSPLTAAAAFKGNAVPSPSGGWGSISPGSGGNFSADAGSSGFFLFAYSMTLHSGSARPLAARGMTNFTPGEADGRLLAAVAPLVDGPNFSSMEVYDEFTGTRRDAWVGVTVKP